jgi:beta-galactosidase
MASRRKFIANSIGVVAGALATSGSATPAPNSPVCVAEISLCGEWLFRTDKDDRGEKDKWFEENIVKGEWRIVAVPHTWQVEAALADHRGVAWYWRTFDPPAKDSSPNAAVRLEFEAVFHSAKVWINGHLAGEHSRKGYTAFTLDITKLIRWGATNTIAVRVDSAFNQHMLPRGRSSDWATDGGIFRPVQLLITPKTFVESVHVDAVPDLATGEGQLTISASIRNSSASPWSGQASFRIAEEHEASTVLNNLAAKVLSVDAGAVKVFTFQTALPKAKLWHFDHPHLYRLEFSISGQGYIHNFTTVFGVRRFEIKDGAFYLNGERVRLMGVERMAGSNPEFGMAEPTDRITHDHADMKHLNCVFTRVHWPQDKRVLDYCDRHGILVQVEIPAWGAETFDGMTSQPDEDILENGLEQLREMIARDFNHPSIVVWGLCNEIGGQNPPAYQFAKRMLEEAKRLDPGRLCSYASDSLRTTPQRDVAGLMDFIETNEYYGSWYAGGAEDVARHLDEIHAAFPGKPIVISEYGYCACAPDRPEGDEQRTKILRSHDAVFRSRDFVGGAIFFCYNDYRTQVGDRGLGSLQQRVHGVVDVYGSRKPSYNLLRRECSPIESVTAERRGNKLQALVKVRRDFPAYHLTGYKVHAVLFGAGNIPVELREVNLPDSAPGSETVVELAFSKFEAPVHVEINILRPTSFSSFLIDWKP